MNTHDSIRSVKLAYIEQEGMERAALLSAHYRKWGNLFNALQDECERETGHLPDCFTECALCGKRRK